MKNIKNNCCESIEYIHAQIVDWYAGNGRKNLPWQLDNTPYHTWVSEIMLQQTQVVSVIPRYLQFVKKWPTVFSVAQSDINDVLALWSGLGYYARCRNLYRCAVEIVERFDGVFPSNIKALESLPGIGASTAHAIRTLGFNRHGWILDGNVKRVLARFYNIDGVLSSSAVMKKLWVQAQRFSNPLFPKIHNQAMMDLGARICTLKQPKCSECPLQMQCIAFNKNTWENIPARKTQFKKNIRNAMLFVTYSGGEVLLEKRKSSGVWGGLYCFPMFKDGDDVRFFLGTQHVPNECFLLDSIQHTLSHRRWHLDIYALKHSIEEKITPHAMQWFKIKEINVGLPAPVLKILNLLNHENNSLCKTKKTLTCT